MKLSEMLAKICILNTKVEKLEADKAGGATAKEKTDLVAQIGELEAAVTGELTEATNNLATLTAKLEKAQGEVNAKGTELGNATARVDKFLKAAKVEIKEGTTLMERIEAALGSMTMTLAKQGIKMEDIPAASEDANKGNVDHAAKYQELVNAGKGLEASRYYFAHRAEISGAPIAKK